jgi:hypothetical protein
MVIVSAPPLTAYPHAAILAADRGGVLLPWQFSLVA